MKIAVFSSLPKNSGCWLRASYLADSLQGLCEVELIEPLPKSLPFMLDMIISIPINIFRIIFSKADFIIGIKPFPNVTIPLRIAKYLRGKTIAVDIDDVDFGYRKGIISKIGSMMQKPMPKHFDVVTYHNDLLKDYIVKEFGVSKDKLYKLDQGVDLNIFKPNASVPEEESLFYMGHLNIASDLDAILEAVKIVQKRKNVEFVVAGCGPDENKFRKLAEKMGVNARFTGRLSEDELIQELVKAGICLVYYKEKEVNAYRCSMKLRECLAMGKKVVCNDFGDLKKFSKYTYQSSSDIENYAKKILSVLQKNDNREKQGAEYIRKTLDWKKIGKDFFDKINSIADNLLIYNCR